VKSLASGALAQQDVDRYRADLAQVAPLLKKLPPLRAQELAGVVHDVAAQRGGYSRQRALTLFSTLEENESYLQTHALPAPGTDVAGPDGVVYRYFPGHGLVFHPLGNFSQLNTLVGAKQTAAAQQLAQALLERAVPCRSGLCWEYLFPYSAGKPPWTSGMVQAVAAQAFARLGMLDAARAAFRAIPGALVLQLPTGPWIRLYSWSSIPVLNAQLQALISLIDYAQLTGDGTGDPLVEQMLASTSATLPKFDTGYWTLYSLAGDESPLSYHEYVVAELKHLAAKTGDTRWRDYATKFEAYESQPPIVKLGSAPKLLYPEPRDGYLDSATFHFWLSKRSSVTLHVAGRSVPFSFGRGERTITWTPGTEAPGLYHPSLTVVDQNGNRTEVPLGPVELRYALAPPNLTVAVAPPQVLSWQSTDEGTPWLRLVLRLAGSGKTQQLDLGKRPLAGSVRLDLPAGRWHATLVAANSAGKTRRLSLGVLPR
jgi:hypothetical protein